MSYQNLINNGFPDLAQYSSGFTTVARIIFQDVRNSCIWTASFMAANGAGLSLRCWKSNLSLCPTLYGMAVIII